MRKPGGKPAGQGVDGILLLPRTNEPTEPTDRPTDTDQPRGFLNESPCHIKGPSTRLQLSPAPASSPRMGVCTHLRRSKSWQIVQRRREPKLVTPLKKAVVRGSAESVRGRIRTGSVGLRPEGPPTSPSAFGPGRGGCRLGLDFGEERPDSLEVVAGDGEASKRVILVTQSTRKNLRSMFTKPLRSSARSSGVACGDGPAR